MADLRRRSPKARYDARAVGSRALLRVGTGLEEAMFELAWIPLLPKIRRFGELDRTLAYSPKQEPFAKKKIAAKMCERFTVARKSKPATTAKARWDVLQALEAKYEKLFMAPCEWRKNFRGTPDLKNALEQQVEGQTTAIEALVASEDWLLMHELLVNLPLGQYANGRIVNAVDQTRSQGMPWLGGCKDGLAHGPVVGYGVRVKAHYLHGRPDGVCTYRDVGRLEVRYSQGQRTGDASYTRIDTSGELRIEGPWVGTGAEALPKNAKCVWLSDHGYFRGTITASHVEDSEPRFGVVTHQDGVTGLASGTGISFDGQLDMKRDAFSKLQVDGRGSLTLPISDQPHVGSELVSHGRITGIWENNLLKQGSGDVTLKDGKRYVGEFGSAGSLHGAGVLTWSNGAQYAGTFANNSLKGQGIMTWPGGQRAMGMFYSTPTWQLDATDCICHVAYGNGAGMQFTFDANGLPAPETIIRLGTVPATPEL